MSCGIYKIENLINHKVYIGQSKNIEVRWRAHRTAKDDYSIHQAIQKYGVENFEFSIIEECEPDQLNEKEIYWINQYNSYTEGYNETLGGSHAVPTKLSLEQVEEISKLLATNKYPNKVLAEKFGVSENVISGINTGYYWKRSDIDYPIAKERMARREANFCIDCGTPIAYGSTRCVECSRKARRMVERPSKEELQQLLLDNNGNMTGVGRIFGVTYSTIRKWCKGYGLPFTSGAYKAPAEPKKPRGAPSPKQKIEQYTLSGELVATFESITEAEKKTGIYHLREASDPTNLARKTAGGYIWKRVS